MGPQLVPRPEDFSVPYEELTARISALREALAEERPPIDLECEREGDSPEGGLWWNNAPPDSLQLVLNLKIKEDGRVHSPNSSGLRHLMTAVSITREDILGIMHGTEDVAEDSDEE